MKETGMMSRSNTTRTLLERFRLDIILCRYEDGEQVRELELAEKYQTSRAAVRNALMVLEHEGLIITQMNGTKWVKRLTVEDIIDLYDMRNYIENKAIEQIFTRPNRDFSALTEIVNRLKNLREESVEELLSLDAAFHREAIAIGGNRAITQSWDMMDGVTEAIFRLNVMESAEEKKWYADTVADRHTQLLVALLSDENKSKELFSGHIQDALAVSIKVMEQCGRDK